MEWVINFLIIKMSLLYVFFDIFNIKSLYSEEKKKSYRKENAIVFLFYFLRRKW